MELTLVSGRYTVEEVTHLLNSLVALSSEYIKAKKNAIDLTEQEVMYSEDQMAKLQHHVRTAISTAQRSGVDHVFLHSKIIIEHCPAYLTV